MNELNLNKILIVDDNFTNIQTLTEYLTNEDFVIESAYNSKYAFEKIQNFRPDLMIIDVLMSEIDGFELCKLIKSNVQSFDVPFIFITELTHHEEMIKAFNCGAVDYISKPFTQFELLFRIKNHLRLIKQNQTIIEQNKQLKLLNEEKNGILELTAHDLKNPLQSIIGFSDLILTKLDQNDSTLLTYTHSIKASALKAVNIIKDLNEVNLIEEGKLSLSITELDVRDVMMKVIEDYLFIAESKKQVIIYNESEKEIKIKSDKSKLTRIFDNLISNALKFSNPNTKIFIECDVKENFAVVSIKDEGPGFTEDDKLKIFGKFAKLSAKPTLDESSTGLGLSIVKRLTELLGGKIELHSEQGKGSTFCLTFELI